MIRAAILALCLAGGLAACGASSSTHSASASTSASTSEPTSTPTSASAAAHPATMPEHTTVKVVQSQYGSVLADKRGQAFYAFGKDSGARSQCYGACASRWPPALAKGKLVAGAGAHARLLGRTRRGDGRLQLTYAGHPLYYYDADRPGRILCQGAEEFGGSWLVVRGSGAPVR